MDDEEFLRRLKALTPDAAVWDDFDPSSWRAEVAKDLGETDQVGDAKERDDWAGTELWEEEPTTIYVSKKNKAREYASDEPLYVRDPAELEKVEWEETGLARGELSAEGETFVPWTLVEGYPDMYVGKRNSVRARPFFTLDALHENRVWDLYYLHRPTELTKKPAILVPTYQFQHLLDVVNARLETQLTIPAGNEKQFKLSFGLGNSPRPRFLGRSDTPERFETLRAAIPAPKPGDGLDHASQVGREEFISLLSVIRQAEMRKRDNRTKSQKNQFKRIRRHEAWGRSVKRVQRYLSLRHKLEKETAPSTEMNAVLDTSFPTTQAPEGSVLFVAIDIEAYEENQNVITELGIATLDTKDIRAVAPGDRGENWFPLISARHIRVKENSWVMNSRYVQGCADNFDFGTSEFIKQADIPSILEQLVDKATLVDPVDGTAKPRPVVLVFHECSGDISFLKTLGYSIYNAENVLEIADTREMHQFVARSDDSRALGAVLNYLDIPSQHLHNAGNDAVYTLRAMIGLAVKKRLMSLEKAGGSKPLDHHIPYFEYMERERQREGWTSGEDTDGGEAVKPVNPDAEFYSDDDRADPAGW